MRVEASPLLPTAEDAEDAEGAPSSTSKLRTIGMGAMALLGAGLATAGVMNHQSRSRKETTASSQLVASADPVDGALFCISAKHESYDGLEQHTLDAYGVSSILEPYVRNVLTAAPCEGVTFSNSYHVQWTTEAADRKTSSPPELEFLDGVDNSPEVFITAGPINAVFRITATVTDDVTGAVHVVSHTNSVVRTVRREIYDLTEDDRAAYFNALHEVFTLDQAAGQELYGSDFTSHATLAALHNSVLYTYHANLFFQTSHPAMQLRLDQSLRAIDMTVQLPYWDFLKDAHLGDQWFTAKVYQDDWFGPTTNTQKTDYRVTGRFSDVMRVYDPESQRYPDAIHDVYGYLGYAHSTNPSSHMQRASTVCGYQTTEGFADCAHVEKCFDKFSTTQSLYDYNMCMEHYVHANLHTMHGGMWGCEESWQKFYEENEDWLDVGLYNIFAVNTIINSDSFIMSDLTSCPTSCNATRDTLESCRCESSLSSIKSPGDVDTLSEEDVETLTTDAWLAVCEYDLHGRKVAHMKGGKCVPYDMKQTHKTKLDRLILKTILWPGYYSDMMSGAAANDPLFWVMHQVFDKASHALRLSPLYNKGKMDWDNGAYTNGKGWDVDTPFKMKIFEPLIGSHHMTNEDGYLTNKALWSLLAPNGPSIGYVYDNLKHWGSCSFDPMLKTRPQALPEAEER